MSQAETRSTAAEGLPTLQRFNALPDQIVWYYAGVLETIRGRVPIRLERELGALARELRDLVEGAGAEGAGRSPS